MDAIIKLRFPKEKSVSLLYERSVLGRPGGSYWQADSFVFEIVDFCGFFQHGAGITIHRMPADFVDLRTLIMCERALAVR